MPEPEPDRAFLGDVVTLDEAAPRASAVLVTGERITFVGDRVEALGLLGTRTVVTELGSRTLLPGFVEPHGHPTTAAVALGDGILDVRPVTLPDAAAVVDALERAVADAGPAGVYANGWDPLLQIGLPRPTRAWLDRVSPETPLAIMHNSGHTGYFNSAAARVAGLDETTPDPPGGAFGRDARGALDGTAREMGAVLRIFGHLMVVDDERFVELVRAETARMNRAGITTVADMGYDPASAGRLQAARDADALTTRLRLYEMSGPQLVSDARPGDGDALVRQVGIKLWADGSPWVGSIAASFDYLDNPTTRELGIVPPHRGHPTYSPEQLLALSRAYADAGWQLACHAHGDLAIAMTLDAWDRIGDDGTRPALRHRLEHVGAITPALLARARQLDVTASLFVAHLYYWGDVLVDELLGEARGSAWVPARSALDAGLRISFHNDGTVTPAAPLRNIEVAATRRTRGGRVLAPQERIDVAEALRAQTIDAAHQLHSEHEIGSIAVGKYADLVVLAANPLDVDPVQAAAGSIADIAVVETVLGGRTVFQDEPGTAAPAAPPDVSPR